jgi:hypothetical protein
MAKIHQSGDFHALMRRRESEIVYRVVRDGEGVKVDLPDAKVSARLNLLYAVLERSSAFARFFVADVLALAYVSVASFSGNIDGAIDGSEQHAQTTGMVAMFMGDQHGVELLYVFADERQPARDLFGAESGVNKNTSLAGNDQNRIAS